VIFCPKINTQAGIIYYNFLSIVVDNAIAGNDPK
jgi:hypothetical protein